MEQVKEEISVRRGVECVRFGALDDLDFTDHGFMLRKGGVSTGCFESMNLSFVSGDIRENVEENYFRAAGYFGMGPGDIATVYQTHTNRVIKVGKENAGSGVTRERIYPDADGMVTDERGVLLATSHADCVPLFFADPVRKAVGLAHSGWKGTAGRIGAVTVKKMAEEFGTNPEDMIAAVGPAICGNCYEVGPDVAGFFIERYGEAGDLPTFLKKKDGGKFLLDLKAANVRILMDAGVRRENITVSGFCTFERNDLFFSHRKMGKRRGGHRAFIMIKE